jgi:PIN domain nuclease of toxin-antitoxin system
LILLDTHVVIWLALEPERISRRAKNAIDEARRSGSGLGISDFTLLEIAQLAYRGRVAFPGGLESFLAEVEQRFTVFPLTARISVQALSLPTHYPNDPGDARSGRPPLSKG